MALKCADLGHLAANWGVHQKWVAGLEEELFRQGDLERQQSLPVSPLMDRAKGGITKSQASRPSACSYCRQELLCTDNHRSGLNGAVLTNEASARLRHAFLLRVVDSCCVQSPTVRCEQFCLDKGGIRHHHISGMPFYCLWSTVAVYSHLLGGMNNDVLIKETSGITKSQARPLSPISRHVFATYGCAWLALNAFASCYGCIMLALCASVACHVTGHLWQRRPSWDIDT